MFSSRGGTSPVVLVWPSGGSPPCSVTVPFESAAAHMNYGSGGNWFSSSSVSVAGSN